MSIAGNRNNSTATATITALPLLSSLQSPPSSCGYKDSKGTSILVTDPAICLGLTPCEVATSTCTVLRSFAANVTGFTNITAVGNMGNYKNSYLAITNAPSLDLRAFHVSDAVEYLNIENIATLDLTQLPTPLPSTMTTLRMVNCNLKEIPSAFQWPNKLNRVGLDSNRLTTLPSSLPENLQLVALRHNQLTNLTWLPAGLGGINVLNNSIQTLSGVDWRDVTYVELGLNPLTTFAHVRLSAARLTYFGLSNCPLTNLTVDASSFRALRNLPPFYINSLSKATGYRIVNTSLATNVTACQSLNGTVEFPWPDAANFSVCVVLNAPLYQRLPWALSSLLWIGAVMAGLLVLVLVWVTQRTSQSRRRKWGYIPLKNGAKNPFNAVKITVALHPPVVMSKLEALRPFKLKPSDVVTTSKYPIAHGVFGEIWGGLYKDTKVAIKRVKQPLPMARPNDTPLPPGPSSVDKFIDEVHLVSQLKHDHIVTFVGANWTSNASDLEIVMEYMDTGDLRAFLATHSSATYSWTEKAQVMRGILAGLCYLHSLPLVHGDLKSKNVLLDSRKGTKLTDFGEKPTNFAAPSVMFQWTAPEVLAGRPFDVAADVYSFGVILSELSTHMLPYADKKLHGRKTQSPQVLMSQIVAGTLQPTFLVDAMIFPSWVYDMAMRCLALDPIQRPTAADLVAYVMSHL
ncbi:serine/threonine protein kinase [Aphanomyces invadans]|uniref:Serine/threonine protein kinase n=1 Tax=Aphanomyces invadans TaxID=157072 RepID=A0A024T8X1_9STRA|nr:serine/threonine protein kinase [Aphanomyces invadans]ETV90468.1 serine/threonine protein kinase [Aphanomyces invadans]|eukprot:XP_008880896.1 serine/threonine protein kinase [Aphanomyces invadans]